VQRREAIMTKKATTDKQSLQLIIWDYCNTLHEMTGGNKKNCNAVMNLVFLEFGRDKFDMLRKEGF
jgi:hypothetical protein